MFLKEPPSVHFREFRSSKETQKALANVSKRELMKYEGVWRSMKVLQKYEGVWRWLFLTIFRSGSTRYIAPSQVMGIALNDWIASSTISICHLPREKVYRKVWGILSLVEQKILRRIQTDAPMSVADIMNRSNMKKNLSRNTGAAWSKRGS